MPSSLEEDKKEVEKDVMISTTTASKEEQKTDEATASLLESTKEKGAVDASTERGKEGDCVVVERNAKGKRSR